MGSCLSCCGEQDSGAPRESNERTHLLTDPTSNAVNNINRVQSDEFLSRYPNSVPRQNDEQSALSRILQETATNVIDVSALDTHDLDSHECVERSKIYSTRLNVLGRWTLKENHVKLLADISTPDIVLIAEPMTLDNFKLITTALEKTSKAVSLISVEHKEDLVVPFTIP